MPTFTLLLIQSSRSFPLDKWLPLLIPLIILELILLLVALIDLIRRDPRQVRGESKLAWALVILLVSTLGPICYLLLGRKEEVETDGHS